MRRPVAREPGFTPAPQAHFRKEPSWPNPPAANHPSPQRLKATLAIKRRLQEPSNGESLQSRSSCLLAIARPKQSKLYSHRKSPLRRVLFVVLGKAYHVIHIKPIYTHRIGNARIDIAEIQLGDEIACSMNADTETQAQIACDIAAARLQVAEQLRQPIAGLASILTYIASDSWLAAIGITFLLLILVPYSYSKEYDKAWDNYERVTGTGKYYRAK